jgi:uncharacterized protein (DUF488 family)
MMTIGHSNRPLQELIDMLRAHGVDLLVDVRTVPKSRYSPQFNAANLPAPLLQAGIEYRGMPELGGLRRARKDSINTGWRNDSFRGYADYMQTPEFDAALDQLLQATEGRQAAVMCAEAVPWRCHRSLIADALTARGIAVEHIMSAATKNPHRMTNFARVEATRVSYPAETLELFQQPG